MRVGCQGMRDAWNLGLDPRGQKRLGAGGARPEDLGRRGGEVGGRLWGAEVAFQPAMHAHLGPEAGPTLEAPRPGSRRRERPPAAAVSSCIWGPVRAPSPRPVSLGTASAHPDPNLPARSPAPGSSKPLLLQPRKVPGPGRRSCRRGPGKTPPPTVPEVAAPTLRSDCTSV